MLGFRIGCDTVFRMNFRNFFVAAFWVLASAFGLSSFAQEATTGLLEQQMTMVSGNKSAPISVFVKSPEEIKALQDELLNLKEMAGTSKPKLDSLLERANRIAKMNDQCSMVSINEVLDTACGHFYEVELPAFEDEYMDVTGEIRLGSMRMATSIEERTRQLVSCSEALTSIVVPREQLLQLKGNMYLEPVNFRGDFDADYKYALTLDPRRMALQERLANLWISKCGDIVERQSGGEFAPMFIAFLKMKNDSLKKSGSNVKLVMNKKNMSIRVDMRRPVGGSYYLNGLKLFTKEVGPDKEKTHLRFDIKNKTAVLEMGQDGELGSFEGRIRFENLTGKGMIGRWMWDSEKQAETIAADESERDKKPADEAEFNKICDNIENAQNMRTVSFGIAALGLVGLGVSFFF